MLTVGSLVSDCGLELIAGDDDERPIRWVHISELEDPTPWLSGGELLLTTGIQLSSPARQRRVSHPPAGPGGGGPRAGARGARKTTAQSPSVAGAPPREPPCSGPHVKGRFASPTV